MANYTTANLVKAQLALDGAFASQDRRFRSPAVWLLFLMSAGTMFNQAEQAHLREDRSVELNYYKRSQRALGSTRAHDHTGDHGDSGVLTPSWATKSDKFSMTLKQQDMSVLQNQLDNEYLNTIANFMEGLDDLASDALVNNRTGVNNAGAINGSFNTTNDVFELDYTLTDNAMLSVMNAKTIMDINKYSGQLVFICDSISFMKFQTAGAQGVSNSTNYSFQFNGIEFVHDPALLAKATAIDATYTLGFFEVVVKGTIGASTWIPKQNRMGVTTSVNRYSTISNPFDGQIYALHTYETRANGTSVNGQTQDVVTQFEVSLDVALESAPLSVADETVIFAFALVESAS